ncbi:hypothetical protein MRX96_031127 [Rhipicephalus microplus]
MADCEHAAIARQCSVVSLPSESPEHVCCVAPVAVASAASSSSVKNRRALSLEIKECVIRDIESDLKKASVAAKYGASDTTVSTIYKNKDKLRQQLQQDSSSLSRKRIRHDDFNPLNAWIQRFKDRHGISCKVVCGESGAVDDESIEVWLRFNLESMLLEKSLQCLSFVEDEIVRSAVRKHRQTKMMALLR